MFVLYWLVIVERNPLGESRRCTQRMRTFLRENGLSLFFLTIFLATLVAQSFAGQHTFNAEQAEHGPATVPGGTTW